MVFPSKGKLKNVDSIHQNYYSAYSENRTRVRSLGNPTCSLSVPPDYPLVKLISCYTLELPKQ